MAKPKKQIIDEPVIVGLQRWRFGLQGISPIKFDRFLIEPTPKTPKGFLEQAKRKVYRNEKEELCIPVPAIEAVLRKATQDSRFKKSNKKEREQEIRAYVRVKPLLLTLKKKDYDEIAVDIVTRPGGKKVPTYRPLVKEWQCEGEIGFRNLDEKYIEELLMIGGDVYGLLGDRPKYGRYIVTLWEEIK